MCINGKTKLKSKLQFQTCTASILGINLCLSPRRFNEFDHKFFGITETEVEQMDPQQKLLLQCAYRALENAGMPMEKASGTKTGVFIGKVDNNVLF